MRLYSTKESTAAGEPTVLAIVETLLATGLLIWLSLHYNTTRWLALAVCLAPLSLLRTEDSVQRGAAVEGQQGTSPSNYLGSLAHVFCKHRLGSAATWMVVRARNDADNATLLVNFQQEDEAKLQPLFKKGGDHNMALCVKTKAGETFYSVEFAPVSPSLFVLTSVDEMRKLEPVLQKCVANSIPPAPTPQK